MTSDLPALWMAPEYLRLLESRAVGVRVRAGEQPGVTVPAVSVR